MELDLTTVIEAMAVGVFICDTTGKLVVVNSAALEMIGATSLEEVNRGGEHLFAFPKVRGEDGKPIPPECMPFKRALAGEEVVLEIEVLEAVRGMMIMRTRTTPLRDRDGTVSGAIKLAVDVTKEYELARARDEFIRQAAHELKTPVAVIKANAQSLAGQCPPELIQPLTRGVDRIDGLINSLLDLLELEGGLFSFSRMPVPISRLIEGAIARLPARAARRINVVSAIEARVDCDEARMRRALYSILDNALKYSPSSSQVELAARVEAAGIAHLVIRAAGVGIPAQKQAHVFEKFFRAHAGTPHDAGGIGVGLFVARAIIVQHGGRIWFESVENRGTTFFVELPIEGETR